MKKLMMLLVCAAVAVGTFGCGEKSKEDQGKDAGKDAVNKVKDIGK